MENINFSNLSDEELLSLVKQGDRKALVAIYDRHAAALYLHIRNQVPYSLSFKQVQDDGFQILAKVFTSFWKDREKLTAHKKLKEHLDSIASHELSVYITIKENLSMG